MFEKYEEFVAFSPPWVDFTQILKEKQNGPNKYLDVLTITLMEEQKQQLKISILSCCVFQETKHHEWLYTLQNIQW